MSTETLLPPAPGEDMESMENMGVLPYDPTDDLGAMTSAVDITAADLARVAIDLTNEELAKFVEKTSADMSYTTTRTGANADDAEQD